MFQEKNKQVTNGEEDVQLVDTRSESGDGGHLLDLVYAVMIGQSPDELEGDGWLADEIHEAVGEMGLFERR